MIPADHWHDNGDGTAWVMTHTCDGDHRLSVGCHKTYMDLDRPCDTCDGEGNVWDDEDGGSYDCPDCDGTGRHTFTVDAKREWGALEPRPPLAIPIRTLRVHVLDVLPIHDECADMDPPDHICQAYRDEKWIWHADYGRTRAGETESPITLPPAARPGMFAVRLAVH